jgi:hypothetical protein
VQLRVTLPVPVGPEVFKMWMAVGKSAQDSEWPVLAQTDLSELDVATFNLPGEFDDIAEAVTADG